MARGGVKIESAYDRAAMRLRQEGSAYRLRRDPRSPYLQVRQVEGGRTIRQFSVKPLRADDDAHIEEAVRLCLEATAAGRWATDAKVLPGTTWGDLAAACIQDVDLRIVKLGSKRTILGHLRNHIARFEGPVHPGRLVEWAKEVDPVQRRAPFQHRLNTLAQIEKAGLMDLRDELAELRAARPRGAAGRLHKASTMKVRVIPADLDLQDWLDSLEGPVQWLLAAIATYGLRPHEAWLAEPPDDLGWVTVPGELLTKTCRHHAPPVPAAWVDRYNLRQRWLAHQAAINRRWTLRWTEVSGKRIPVNGTAVTRQLWDSLDKGRIPKLFAPLADGSGGRDWVRPYDLRHAYAIRCSTHQDVAHALDADRAAWMGHGLDVHQRTYLRWMTSDAQKEALQRRLANPALAPRGGPQEAPGLPQDVLDRLAKLEALEALLTGR